MQPKAIPGKGKGCLYDNPAAHKFPEWLSHDDDKHDIKVSVACEIFDSGDQTGWST